MTTQTAPPQHGVLLVGHGGVPADCPAELIQKLVMLEKRREATGGEMSAEEVELDTRVRQWPRTAENDPYQAGVEALAAALQPLLHGDPLAIAYNEFCAPTMQDAVADLVAQGVMSITVLTTMLTPGGKHSEVEIPEIVASLNTQYPHVDIRYAWPTDLDAVARLLAHHIDRTHAQRGNAA